MPQQRPRVLVFDSGLGGLTVAREIRAAVPQAELIYYADTAYFPYGDKPEADLIERVLAEMRWLEQCYQPQLIVIACNTASTLVLPQLRAQTGTPIVGVVPAVKPAAALSRSGVIGLLATPGTVMREYTALLIRQFAGHCEVVSVGSTELVLLAEGKLRGRPVGQQALRDILAPFHEHPLHAKLDTIVLACTHFPLLRDELARSYARQVHWLDSGAAIAQRVHYLLSQQCSLAQLAPVSEHRALFSATPAEMTSLLPWLRVLGLTPEPLPGPVPKR